MSNYTQWTPDYSPLVVHFTKEPDRAMARADLIDGDHPLFTHKERPAIERLINILQSKMVYASPMPDLPNSPSAVCFTECMWDALIRHADQYSPYGVAFSKEFIFEKGGGPALYIRGDILKLIGQDIPSHLEPFIVPFDPTSALQPGVEIDTVQEREWRLPDSLEFEDSDIRYIIVENIQDAHQVIQRIGLQHIPERKFIPMDVYRTIREAWREV